MIRRGILWTCDNCRNSEIQQTAGNDPIAPVGWASVGRLNLDPNKQPLDYCPLCKTQVIAANARFRETDFVFKGNRTFYRVIRLEEGYWLHHWIPGLRQWVSLREVSWKGHPSELDLLFHLAMLPFEVARMHGGRPFEL